MIYKKNLLVTIEYHGMYSFPLFKQNQTLTKVVEKKILLIVCVKRYFFKVENNCLGLKDIYLTLTNISPGFSKKWLKIFAGGQGQKWLLL